MGCADSFPARKLSGVGASPGAAGLVPLNCQTVHPIGAPGRGIALEGPRPPGLVPADEVLSLAPEKVPKERVQGENPLDTPRSVGVRSSLSGVRDPRLCRFPRRPPGFYIRML